MPDGWTGDGIIARISTSAIADRLRREKVPLVNVSGIRLQGVAFPRVCTDNDKLAQFAVEHFVDRGLQNIGYIGLSGREYSVDRQQSTLRACTRLGCNFSAYRPATGLKAAGRWNRDRASIGIWLQKLPKPVGVLAWGVRRGTDVIEQAVAQGLRVPDEVAVLGDDDDLLCEAVAPSLSGIILPCEQIGLEAAATLDLMMRGEKPKRKELAFEPTGILARTSTDVLAIDDQEVADALQIIRNHASEPLTVKEIADTLAVSRRSLERKFQHLLQRTVREEITRAHLDKAKLLLATTDWPMPAVAQGSGYGTPEYLATVFKRYMGISPRQYRKQCQGR